MQVADVALPGAQPGHSVLFLSILTQGCRSDSNPINSIKDEESPDSVTGSVAVNAAGEVSLHVIAAVAALGPESFQKNQVIHIQTYIHTYFVAQHGQCMRTVQTCECFMWKVRQRVAVDPISKSGTFMCKCIVFANMYSPSDFIHGKSIPLRFVIAVVSAYFLSYS
ncbi:hypothetical protein JOB18_006504 [Solea senegalensis]|uniref:Uncharacterized protein n=1 Tax=Solea senegalensis TaxID=28829 RepID=A0AAV6PSG8_SOLSE|nr:hypothetical protein JOB18_006504 [Solea senegalensis]